MFEIIRTLQESDRTDNFVAIGNLFDANNRAYHSAIILQYKGIMQEFHYTGQEIVFDNVSDDYYHKVTNTIHPDEIPAFIAMCRNVQAKANPRYGYFYSGESYNKEGIHNSAFDFGERMTCVGFCLNILKGFLDEDYLQYADWTSDDNDIPEGYLEDFCTRYNIDPSTIIARHRRITPLECLTSCFFVNLPIGKMEIDEKIMQVQDYFNMIFNLSTN